MTNTPYYPDLPIGLIPMLQVVQRQMDTIPDYLDRPECPFSEDTKAYFRGLRGGTITTMNIFDATEDKTVVIEQQIQQLISDLNSFASTLGKADASERLQFFKTKAGLLDKLISMQERTYNLREMAVFQSTVMGFLEDLCTKDQIKQLMERFGK